MKPHIIACFIYPSEDFVDKMEMLGQKENLKEMDLMDVTFYTIGSVSPHPYEGRGGYTIINSDGQQFISPLSIGKVKAIIEA